MGGDELGERLEGNVGGAWRVGNTVRRTTGPWTPAVHALLAHLQSRLAAVPEVFGFDGRGREVLSFLPGRVIDVDCELLSTGQLRSMVNWTLSFIGLPRGSVTLGPGAPTEPNERRRR